MKRCIDRNGVMWAVAIVLFAGTVILIKYLNSKNGGEAAPEQIPVSTDAE